MENKMDAWALTEWGKPLQKIRLPLPQPTGTEVLVEVTHAGLCHSDLHLADGFYDMGNGETFNVKDRGIKLPLALGHEIVGRAAKVGPGSASVAIGSYQIVYPWLGCGSCTRCSHGEDNLCAAQKGLGTLRQGGFAEYVLVPHPKYLFDVGDLDPAVACTFGCSGITTLNAVSKVMPMEPTEPVLLIGGGGLGLAAIAVLKSYGHTSIVSVDIADDKLAAARVAGATKTVNSRAPNAIENILAATGGPVTAVIDFVNSSSTATMVKGLVAKGANWVQVGIMGGLIEFSLVANIFKGLTMYSILAGTLAHLEEVVRLAKRISLGPVSVEIVHWDSVNEAMERLRTGKAVGRIVLVK